MAIRDLQARLVELGRLRAGERGPKGEPKRLANWRMTSASLSLLQAASVLYGGKPRPWPGAPDAGYFELLTESAEVDVVIPPTLASYSQWYEIWEAGGIVSRCDGFIEQLTDEPCDHGDHADYQIYTRLNVMLPRLPGLGVWRMESHGWNAATTIPATMELLRMMGATGFVPAVLRIEQRSKKVRDERGKAMTHRWGEPRLDLAGTPAQLLAAGSAAAPALALPSGPIVALQRDAEAVEPTPINKRERVSRPALEAAPDLPAQAQGRAATTPFGEQPPFPGEAESRPSHTAADAQIAPNGADVQPSLDLPAAAADPLPGEIVEMSLADFTARVNHEHLTQSVAPARKRLFGAERAQTDLAPGELGRLYAEIRRPVQTPITQA